MEINEKENIIIGVSGSIAVGKTTLINKLVNILPSSQIAIEDARQNPYIDDFYNDMKKWCFHSRISFLGLKLNSYSEIDKRYKYALIDRSIEELTIFAEHQFKLGNFDEKEYKVYNTIYQGILNFVPKLDIMLYLNCSPEVSLDRVKKRNSPYEKGVTLEYLTKLNYTYEEWLKKSECKNIIVINTEQELNLSDIVNQIQSVTKCI